MARKLFNFYKSYYDVFNTIPKDEDKLQFIKAVLERQFTGREPDPSELSPMALLAYKSQEFNINSQVEGYENKTGEHPDGTPLQEGVGKGVGKGVPKGVKKGVPKGVGNNRKGNSKYKRNSIFIPPSCEEVESYFKENGFKPEIGKKAWQYYEAGLWRDAKGNPVINWKQKVRGNWFTDDAKIKNDNRKKESTDPRIKWQ